MAYTPSSRDQHSSGQDHDRIDHNRDEFFMPDPEEDQDVSISIAQKMLSAVSGSLLTSLLVTPLDVVRVRLQSQPHTHTTRVPTLPTQFSNLPPSLGISSCCREVFWVNNNAPYCVAGPPSSSIVNSEGIACAIEETNARTFNSTLDGIRKIAKNEGPLTLWRGLSPTLAMAIPGNVIYFAGYDWLRAAPQSPFVRMGMNDDYAPLFAGSSARILAAIAVSPIEMFRTRMQATRAQPKGSAGSVFRNTANGMREMITDKGMRSLWTGLTLTLWRDVPFSAIYWWGYEAMRNRLTDVRESSRGRDRIHGRSPNAQRLRSQSRNREDHSATLVDSFVAGATSGAVAAFVTTPFDVGKTRQQVVKHGAAMDTSGAASRAAKTLVPEELPMPRFLWHIFKEQGMSGLFRGWTARCLKVAPACAIMISSYEVGKKMAGGINHRRSRDVDR
jgi:solute carrier family 25 protein 39/40